MAAICGNRSKKNSILNTARKDSIKIIDLFETFRIQDLAFMHSEIVKKILSSKNSSFERRGLPPAKPTKMLKLRSNPPFKATKTPGNSAGNRSAS